MIGRCETCKYWGRVWEWQCDRADRWPETAGPSTTFEIVWEALDDSGLEVGLKTGPEFGCVLHEEKD